MWLHLCFPGKFLNVNMKGWRTSFRVLKFFPLRPLISINPERSNQGSRQQLQPLDRLSDADLGQTRPAARWRPVVVRGGTCAPSRSFRLQRSKTTTGPVYSGSTLCNFKVSRLGQALTQLDWNWVRNVPGFVTLFVRL